MSHHWPPLATSGGGSSEAETRACGELRKMRLAEQYPTFHTERVLSVYSPSSGCLYMFDASRPLRLKDTLHRIT